MFLHILLIYCLWTATEGTTHNGFNDSEKLLFSDGQNIAILDLQTGNVTTIATGFQYVLFLGYHDTNSYVFWSDFNAGMIYRKQHLSHGTSNVDAIINGHTPAGIAIDSINDHIYWADTGLGRISRSSINGSTTDVIIDNIFHPVGLAIETTEGLMFFTSGTNVIERSKLDGSARHIVNDNIGYTENVALELNEKRIYWTDHGRSNILSAFYDGSDVQLVYSQYAWSLDVGLRFIYFSTSWRSGQLYRVAKDQPTSSSQLHVQLGFLGGVTALKLMKTVERCYSYKELQNEQKRSSGYVLDNQVDVPFNDEKLEEGWYRFINDENGDAIPTFPPGVNHCGTKNPVWLNGTLPLNSDDVDERNACIQTTASVCEFTVPVNISRCPQDFYVYYLLPTPKDSAYCFGKGPVRCGEGLSSESGYYPECSSSFPNDTLTSTVKAELVEGETHSGFPVDVDPGPSLKPVFICRFNETGDSQHVYDVHWFINNDNIAIHKNVPFANIDSTILYEEDWVTTHKMNMEVQCAVRIRYANNTIPSPYHYSKTFLAGVYPQKSDYVVVEGESINITYTSTVPIGCIGSSTILMSTCHQNLYVFQPNKKNSQQKCKNQLAQKDIVFRTGFCGIQFSTNKKGEQSRNLQVFGYTDGMYNFKDRTTYIRLTSTSRTGMWKDITIPDVKISVVDKDVSLTGRLCESYNDPHIRTFDGSYYHYMDVGEYVMYRNNKGPYWVHALFTNCGFGWTGSSCHCGIAIRSRSSLFTVRTCERISRHQKFLLSRPQIELFSCIDDDMVIQETGHQYKITLPIGTEIRFYLSYGFISGLTIKPTVFDLENTMGLCGYLSPTKDPSDDYKHRYTGQSSNDQDFARSWKITEDLTDEQLFVATPTFQTYDENNAPSLSNSKLETEQYCSCEDEAGPSDDVSQFYSVHCNKTDVTENCREEPHTLTNVKKRSVYVETLSSFPKNCRGNHIEKRSIRSPNKRIRRSKEDSDEVTEIIPLTYDDDNDNITLADPTFRNGWTEEMAIENCTNTISRKIPFDTYNDVTDVSVTPYIDSCVMDIKLVGSMSFSEDTLVAIQRYTTMEISRNETLFLQYTDSYNQTVFEYLTSLTCYNNCSGNGLCVSGQCICDEPFIGDDCSKMKSMPPANVQIPFDGLCGKRERQCTRTNVYGEFLSYDVWCLLKHFEIKNDGLKFYTYDEILKAVFRNSYMVSCNFPSSRRKRSTLDSPPEGYDVSLSHDGTVFGESVTIIIYDDECYSCNATTTSCVFLDVCFKPKDDSNTESRTGIIVGTITGSVVLFCLVSGIFIFKTIKKQKCRPVKAQMTENSFSLNTFGEIDTVFLERNVTASIPPPDTKLTGDLWQHIDRSKTSVSVGEMMLTFDNRSYIKSTSSAKLQHSPRPDSAISGNITYDSSRVAPDDSNVNTNVLVDLFCIAKRNAN